MASDKGASRDILDERLAQARDSIMLQDEEIIAQAMGDSGQAIVLTKARVLILKVGLTATGEFGGQRTTAFGWDEISTVNVRKGPLGAVVQICSGENKQVPSADSIVVFSGDSKVKKCEAIAAKIANAIGKTVEKFGHDSAQLTIQQNTAAEAAAANVAKPAPKKNAPAKSKDSVEIKQELEAQEVTAPAPRGGREAKSLAEEMYAEMLDAEPTEVSQSVIEDIKTIDPPVEQKEEKIEIEELPKLNYDLEIDPAYCLDEQDEAEEEEIASDFRPNPRLPKPIKKKSNASSKVLVLLGSLGAIVLMGIAIIAPFKQEQDPPRVEVSVKSLTHSIPVLRKQYNSVLKYREQVTGILQSSDASVSSLKNALLSGNQTAINTAVGRCSTNKMLDKISSIQAPIGLAGAKECLTSGIFMRETASANLAATLNSSSYINKHETLDKLTEADLHIRKGLDSIYKMLAKFKADIPENRKTSANNSSNN